jgi:hypothetical protein
VRDSAASQEENRPTVFLSYANEDQEDVDDIRKFLKACGINTWQDREKLRGGGRWKDSLKDAINDSDYVVVVQTPHMGKAEKGFF